MAVTPEPSTLGSRTAASEILMERKNMKLVISTILLVFLAGLPAYAMQEPGQDNEKDKPKPAQKEEPKKQEPEKQKPEPQEKEKQQKDAPKQPQSEKDRAKQDKPAPEHAQQAQQPQHNNVQQAQRGGNNARRIPEENFRTHFGREHAFHVERRDDRRFNYGGYWFQYNEAWPAGWSYDDNVYVDEIDGEYYLIDPVHPGIRLLVIVAE
jgi:type IV secretory pathway VirB10-like protein